MTGDCDVYKPSGELLLALRRQAIPLAINDGAEAALRHLGEHGDSANRGAYSGMKRIPTGTGKNTVTANSDGIRTKFASAIAGNFDRQGGRFDFCRQTVFTSREVEKWATITPMIENVADHMRKVSPQRYSEQMHMAEKTQPAYVIGKTPFTTITVNLNAAGAIHQDQGDFKDGLGCLSVLRRGDYTGGWLVFPEYRVGVDLQDRDILFFNSHDWHGNTELKMLSEDATRISIVYYYRKRMIECLAPAEEMKRAKERVDAGILRQT